MSSPRQFSSDVCVISREVSMRVERLITRLGERDASSVLGVSRDTLEAARDQGRMRVTTRTRLLEALARSEEEGGT